MTGRIPWTRYSGEDVESVLATFISLEERNAIKIRPSRGDGGIDLIVYLDAETVDIYQIKKFAENLKNSQKAQIENSWQELSATTAVLHVKINSWHLVMPLDPTNENLRWAKELVEPSGTKFIWDGLSRVDGWASKYPEVIDYYFSNGKEEISEYAAKLLSMANLPDCSDPVILENRLRDLCSNLDKLDPYYAYSVHVLSEYDKRDDFCTRAPGVVMSQILVTPGAGRIAIDVIEKTPIASMLHPLTFSVKIIAGTDEEKEQVQNYIEYGMPFTSLPAEVIDQDCQLPVGRSYEGFRRGIIKSFDLNTSNCIRSASLFWEGCGELQLIVDKTTHGTKGVFFSAHDDTETFKLNFKWDASQPGGTLNYEFSFSNLANKRSRDVARTYRFLSEATDKKVDLRINGTSALSFNLDIRDDLIDLINKIYGLAVALETVNRAADSEMPFPDVYKTTKGEIANLRDAARLLDGESVVYSWESHWFNLDGDKVQNLECPSLALWIKPLTVRLGDRGVFCGFAQTTLVVGSFECSTDQTNDSERKLVLSPDDQYGNKAVRVMVPPNEEVLKGRDALWTIRPPKVADWLTIVEAAESSDQMRLPE
ncbi:MULTISPECIES: hypothetical protein [Collinsella]|uniref:hypothetical protein n=1 Tax=Collinsella TaxID=102106 RepID=UPI001C23D4FE|nr:MULTISPECIES: hypothetical protein [Collinsella]MBU9000437.1 hypothetical protein [Collinsella aerofaciens]MBU9063186.1 hypothetical protein [Collinsella sp. MSK.8.10]MCB5368803.1 hypothetical protein [Collinsella aerofaciens]